ncbi:uncharacterized protein BT62DRAFT_982538 [Guyanagaster necrorhizus]|uniref:DDE-1 domain-containing protein n=1 Tax=Guyanagaster necrorhizus TaxID=856835 RepID=A0A9P7VKJ2_9AGAR|nr:uncharacterized protein BT62DRAFT_982538 [Guyanagaster necrorhizus MCA 3950]KAG7442322.1 hypothetical protein BT62DRAFT_982538 [Guyanagaster necrorhizus MCA 3950]
MPSDYSLADKKHSNVKGSKVCLIYAFTINANGSDKKEPFIIGKAYKSHPFQKKSDMQLENILLLQDNFSAHIIPEDDLQCITKAGILSDTPLAPVVSVSILIALLVQDSITDIEKQLKESLDDLQGTDVLQCHNYMDIESLLNLEIENVDVKETMDKDIFDAVMASQSAEEGMDENGLEGDDDGDDDSVLKPCPKCHEAHQAVKTLQKYIEIMNDLFAQNLKSILALFG